MPASGQYRSGSLPSRLRDWFADRPGLYRPTDIAAALSVEATDKQTAAWRVANECGRLYRQGELIRARVPIHGRQQAVTFYGAPIRSRRARAADRQAAREEDRREADRQEDHPTD